MPDHDQPRRQSETLVERIAEAVTQQPRLTDGPNAAGIAADHLRQLIERIERLEEEKQALASLSAPPPASEQEGRADG